MTGCVDAAQHGDAGAQEELVRRFEPLVQRVVWKLRLPPGCERDDLAQEARVGLLSAIRAWRPDRGPFPAFADRCVSNQALLALKATAARKHQILSLARIRSMRHLTAPVSPTSARRGRCSTRSRPAATRAPIPSCGCSSTNS